MNEKCVANESPYKCPGCGVYLPKEKLAAVEHMEHCVPPQDMIDAGRAIRAIRREKKETH